MKVIIRILKIDISMLFIDHTDILVNKFNRIINMFSKLPKKIIWGIIDYCDYSTRKILESDSTLNEVFKDYPYEYYYCDDDNEMKNLVQNKNITKLHTLFCGLQVTEIPKELSNISVLYCGRYENERYDIYNSGDVGPCKLKKLPDYLTNLKKLCIEDDPPEPTIKVSSIPETYTKLQKLNISCTTNIKKLPKTLVNLIMLDSSLSGLTELPETSINLRHINCSESDIKYLPVTLTRLNYLDCHGTKLKIIPQTFRKLRFLCCAECEKLTKIPKTLRRLIILNCNYSGVHFLSKVFKKLITLECCNTNIHSISDTYTNLRVLNIEECPITNLPDTLIKLKTLYCSNILNKIPTSYSSLKFIMGKSNQISNITHFRNENVSIEEKHPLHVARFLMDRRFNEKLHFEV